MSFHVFGVKYSIIIDIRELRTTMNHLTAGNPRPARGTQRLGAFPVASGLDLADGDAAAVLLVQRSLVLSVTDVSNWPRWFENETKMNISRLVDNVIYL